MVKNLPAMKEMLVQYLGQEDTLEQEMATHSNHNVGKVFGLLNLDYAYQFNWVSQVAQ